MDSRAVQVAQSDQNRDELATLGARLEAAAQDLARKTEALRLSRRQRDELMVQAVETGMPMRQVARHASVNASRVIQILAGH